MRIACTAMLALAAELSGAGASAACRPAAVPAARIEGVVRDAASGDTLCIQSGSTHADLTRVRLVDVMAPRLTGPGGEGAKQALRRAARGREAVCEMQGREAGICRIGGRSVAALVSR